MNADGSGLRQVTRFDRPDVVPSWSPDGTHLVFLSIRPEGLQLYVVDRDGGEPRLLVDERFVTGPAWSPDGAWIAFRSFPSGEFRIRRVRAEGGESEPLTRGPSQGAPSWSPDGKRIFFGAGGERGPNIWAVSIEDGAERAMTDFTGRPGTLGEQGLVTDGDYLYFTWDEDVGDLWVMDVVENDSLPNGSVRGARSKRGFRARSKTRRSAWH